MISVVTATAKILVTKSSSFYNNGGDFQPALSSTNVCIFSSTARCVLWERKVTRQWLATHGVSAMNECNACSVATKMTSTTTSTLVVESSVCKLATASRMHKVLLHLALLCIAFGCDFIAQNVNFLWGFVKRFIELTWDFYGVLIRTFCVGNR